MGQITSVQPSCVTIMTGSESYKKLVIVGDGSCGKTSLLSRFVRGEFPRDYVPTVFDTEVSSVTVDGKHVQLSLWDTAGQEAYEQLRPFSYNETDVVVIAYSIADRDTVANVVEKWYPEICRYLPKIPIVLVGTKLDLRPSFEEIDLKQKSQFVSVNDGRTLAGYINADAFIECSALSNVRVNDVFERAALLTLKKPRKAKKYKRQASLCALF